MSDTAAVPAVPDQNSYLPEGLEDFDQSQAIIPTFKIDHDKTCFVDSLTGEEYDELDVIALGLVKQRVLWPPEIGEKKERPLCRSYEFKIGHPDTERFPWDKAGFSRIDNDPELPCESCKLKDWGSHPGRTGDNAPPWCSEQHTYAILQELENGGVAPALITFQRSSIKPSNVYLSGFVRAQEPLFVCHTMISLEGRKRGNVNFAVPKFAKGPATDQQFWPDFARQYKEIRSFVQSPRFLDADTEETDENDVQAESQVTGQQPAASPAQSAAPAASDDDDLPF